MVASATHPDYPYFDAGVGIRTPMGVQFEASGQVVAYVHHSGTAYTGYRPPGMTGIYTTLNAACSLARGSGYHDVVVALPGHAENFAAADALSNLVAGTRIIGLGSGTQRPTFTWTAAGSTVLFNVANASMQNCILYLAATGNAGVTVAAPITVSAAGCAIVGCSIFFGADADDIVTIGIGVTGADCTFSRNHCIGATAAECTTFLNVNAAARLTMHDNIIEGATSSVAVGLLRFVTAASLNIDLQRNTYINRKASSTCAVTGLAAVSGVSRDEHFAYLDTASLTPWLTSTGIMTFHRPSVTNTAGETGTEVVGTVSAA